MRSDNNAEHNSDDNNQPIHGLPSRRSRPNRLLFADVA
jgi:hypothetical protein